MSTIPRAADDDYTNEQAQLRRTYVRQHTGVELSHVGQFSFEPSLVGGNIESFAGVAQVLIGIAGPLLVRGEHARGEFLVPLATTEGTLAASYNRGMKLLSEAGGVVATVTGAMQRAPVFGFSDARAARSFGVWVGEHYYFSITIPSLIVGTYGGGTGLPTQRECLEMMGCYGAGKVHKLAEIMAATVLCGELSLGAAVVAEEWVESHERYGRNRP